MMKKTLKLKTHDSITLNAQLSRPKDQTTVVGVVFIFHGFGEHMGVYSHLVETFIKNQIIAVQMDLRGHGKSGGDRGHIDNISSLHEDINLLFRSVMKRINQKKYQYPLFMYGHSLGGCLILDYILNNKCDYRFKGVIVSSPWLKLVQGSVSGTKTFLAKALNVVYSKYSEDSHLDPHDLTDDPDLLKKYVKDPLIFYKMTTGTFCSFHKSGETITQNAETIAQTNCCRNWLFVQGKNDPIVDWRATKQLANQMKQHTNVTLHLDEIEKHDLHNCRHRNQILELYVDWVFQLIRDYDQISSSEGSSDSGTEIDNNIKSDNTLKKTNNKN
ncbi:monoglyceride lipase [Anaeramoeba flamelloides]|uniref:Monoglyceride lipase n=1 Tax=Anaeramoeba flamelloides TaxID=1746091 RepID=A0AAV8A7R9_9EUKA|nr:monoglyceride lipase [Anaeramoeba flamelloides]